MSKKVKIILIIVIGVLLGCFVILRLEEDTWICDNGQWVKHGAPATHQPEGKCSWTDNLIPFK